MAIKGQELMLWVNWYKHGEFHLCEEKDRVAIAKKNLIGPWKGVLAEGLELQDFESADWVIVRVTNTEILRCTIIRKVSTRSKQAERSIAVAV